MDVACGDVKNAYLNAQTDERIVTLLGKKFFDAGLTSQTQQWARVAKAQYGLPSSGHKWWQMLSDTLIQLGYKRSRGDKDV